MLVARNRGPRNQVQLGIRFRVECGSWRKLRQFHAVHMTGEAEPLERPDAIPIQMNFIPWAAMPRRHPMRMSILLPRSATSPDRGPPVLGAARAGATAV